MDLRRPELKGVMCRRVYSVSSILHYCAMLLLSTTEVVKA